LILAFADTAIEEIHVWLLKKQLRMQIEIWLEGNEVTMDTGLSITADGLMVFVA
jgi:hypothetical protein